MYIDLFKSTFKILKACPQCDTEFLDKHMRLFDQTRGTQTLHIACPTCQTKLIVLVGISDIGAGLIGLMSELTYDDMRRLGSKKPMSDDDLLQAYQILQDSHVLVIEKLRVK